MLNELIYVISEEKPLALDAELLVLLNKDVLDEMKPAERLSSLWSNDLSHFGVSLSASASHMYVSTRNAPYFLPFLFHVSCVLLANYWLMYNFSCVVLLSSM